LKFKLIIDEGTDHALYYNYNKYSTTDSWSTTKTDNDDVLYHNDGSECNFAQIKERRIPVGIPFYSEVGGWWIALPDAS